MAFWSYKRTRLNNIGIGTGESVYVPNQTLPAVAPQGFGRIAGNPPMPFAPNVYYTLQLTPAPVTGFGQPALTTYDLPLLQSIAAPVSRGLS